MLFTKLYAYSFSDEFSCEVGGEGGGAGRPGFCEARTCLCLFQYCIPSAKQSICTERLLKVQLLMDG